MQFIEELQQPHSLEIYHYSPLIDPSRNLQQSIYRFLCDYNGKLLFLQYIENAASANILNYGNLNNLQRVLFSYYFFEVIGLVPRKDIKVSVLLKFLHYTNNMGSSKLENSSFHKFAYRAPDLKSGRKLIPDLQKVRKIFIENNLPTTSIDLEISMRK